MASRAAQTQKTPVKVHLASGSLFAYFSCGSTEFKITGEEAHAVHLFCRCGAIYTPNDLPPLEG